MIDEVIRSFLYLVQDVDDWLDDEMSPEFRAQPLAHDMARTTKVCEEAGEVWKAWSKLNGENPRKGISGTEAQLLEELGDTASAAICAIQHRTKDKARTWEIITAALEKAHARIGVMADEQVH